jgi:hypothetical protein
MHITIATVAMDCLLKAGDSLVQMYTDTALLLNACDVTARSYAERTDDFQLSTTQNIHSSVRLPIEIDVVLRRNELVSAYKEKILKRVVEDFVVRMVSVADGAFEDIYENTLPLVLKDLNEDDILKRVRAAWQVEANGHVKLVNFLVEEAGLLSPPEKLSSVKMVFDRYYELREIRHALVHSGGVLSSKHKHRLSDFSLRLPENLRDGSFAKHSFLSTGEILLSVSDALKIRYWAYATFFGYLHVAFAKSIVASEPES